MAGCSHVRRSNNYCARYGEYMPELGVRMRVAYHPTGQYFFSCNGCDESPMFFERWDRAVEFAVAHQTADHPRDLVAFSINI